LKEANCLTSLVLFFKLNVLDKIIGSSY